MARTRKNKKSQLIKTLVTVGGVLVAAQLAFIFYFQGGTKPKDVKDAIEESLAKQAGMAPKAKDQLRIQLAVNHFQAETGQLPPSLNDLVPTYFDSIPLDPDTQKPFAYVNEGGKFYIGERSKVASGTQQAKNQKDPSKTSLSAEERTAQEQEALIASLDDNLSFVSFVYDPAGKRDPFRSYDATPSIMINKGEGLAGYDLGQLRLTAVVDTIVTIEDQSGKGFIARKGTKVGLNGGEIVEILKDKIKILETTVDFTGKPSSKVIEMDLRSAGATSKN